MPVATYTTINGMLVHESRAGVESFYFPDTLGNLTTVRSATGVKTYGAEYWPYGEIQTETGTNPSPWSFVGLLGYLRDTVSRLYVRARHYRPGPARWQTVDPLWPRESAYGYVRNRPTNRTDSSGLGPPEDAFNDWCRGWNRWWEGMINPPKPEPIYVLPYPYFDPRPLPDYWGYGNWCGKNRPGADNPEGAPVDGLDTCCKAHDKNLGKEEFNGKHGCAHCELARCAAAANCWLSPTPITCLAARTDLRALMSTLCLEEMKRNSFCIYYGIF